MVVSRETGQPISGAHVRFRLSPGRPYGAVSDGGGHFSISGMAAGSYYVQADCPGFLYLPFSDQGARYSVDLHAGERLTDVRIEMARRYAIAGRVVDENGDPLQGALVRAEMASSGETALAPPAQGSRFPILTDDRGEFQLSVAPGRYYISANSPGGLDNQPEIRTDGTSGAPYERTYYPSAPDKTTAVAVAAPADDDPVALLIRLQRQPAAPLTVSPPAGQEPASLGGVVTNEVTGAGVPRVHISLWAFVTQRKYGAMTDADGKFSITGMPEGTYGMLTTRAGFATPPGSGIQVKLRAGERKEDLRLPLRPTGSITGRVMDATGEPVEFATVYASGGSGLFGSLADGQGRFRIGGLPPGSFRLEAASAAEARPAAPPEIRTDGTVETHYGPSYFPAAVNVKAGGESGGIEIRLPRTRLVRVGGQVTGVPRGARIGLSVNDRRGGFSDSPKTDGSFEWWLNPGKYVVSAREGSGPEFGGESRAASAPVGITVGDADIDNLELRILPPSDIQGRVEHESGEAQPPAAKRWLRLPAMDRMGGGASALSADGSFTLLNLLPGRYRVMCDWVPQAYVKSMRLGSTEIQGDILDLSSGSGGAALTVVVSSRFGSISGTVQGDRAAAAGLRVALVAVTPGYVRPPQFADIGADGRYSFDSVVPGDYKLAVVAANDLVIQGADSLAEYEPVVETFDTATVRAGESTTRDPKILKRQ